MPIWKKPLTLELLHSAHANTAIAHLGIEITEIGDDFLRGRVPVIGKMVSALEGDPGDGISPEQQATLFAPFSRLQQHENSRIQGVGLGLAFVHTVMQRHSATIELDSTPGQGSTFKLVFAKR